MAASGWLHRSSAAGSRSRTCRLSPSSSNESAAGGQQQLRLRTNLDAWLEVGPEHGLSLRTPTGVVAGSAPAPYVEVRDGLLARVARSVYYELVELAEEARIGDQMRIGVWSRGHFFALEDPA